LVSIITNIIIITTSQNGQALQSINCYQYHATSKLDYTLIQHSAVEIIFTKSNRQNGQLLAVL